MAENKLQGGCKILAHRFFSQRWGALISCTNDRGVAVTSLNASTKFVISPSTGGMESCELLTNVQSEYRGISHSVILELLLIFPDILC